ncbi:hypothetical protein HELRODRAFT_66814, partial [Helobdella robusta]|uniref:Potassium channel domain-containing protein n=1 Tax=Helobdella robusta TaxID=6412 RepID=T1FYR3_HELRO
ETELQKLFEQVVENLKNGDSIQVLWSKSDGPLGSNWSFDQTLLFAVSVVTLIGYGNMTPKTTSGKIFTVAFAVVGIPMTFLIVAAIVQRIIHFSSKFYYFVSDFCFSGHKATVSWSIYCSAFFLTVLTMFFILPSSIFYYLETDWSWFDSFYFCFVSLTTIGFGDYVPAKDYTYQYKELYTVGITFYLLTGIIFLMALVEEIYKSPIVRSAISLFSYMDNSDNELKVQELNENSKERKSSVSEPYENKGYHSFDDHTKNPLKDT